ncbi:MAG: cell division ATP-binding protein FtsE [Pseudomonadota bacterium]
MIRFENVTKRYAGGHDALSGVSFALEAGDMAFLTGHSGAGKSTLLKLIALIERPTRGQVFINGVNTAKTTARRIPFFRRQVGVVFQDHKLLYDRDVFANVALPLVVAGVPKNQIEKRVRAALDQVGLLHKEQSLPEALSTGEQQRVGIARAVVRKPALLIADEPTGNLDPELSMEIMTIFQRFSEVGVTVMVASHDHHLIQSFRPRLLTLDNGRLVSPDNENEPDSASSGGDRYIV